MTSLTDTITAAQEARAAANEGRADPIAAIRDEVDTVGRLLPAGSIDPERFIELFLAEVRRVPRLAASVPSTLIGALHVAARSGLEPGGPLGQSYLRATASRRHDGALAASWAVGYKGLVVLAARSGITLQARTVRDGDEFAYALGTSEWLHHVPDAPTSAPGIRWYAIARFSDGREPMFVVIDRDAAERARDLGDGGPSWRDWFDAMAEKTAAIRLARWLPLTSDSAAAVAADGVVVDAGATLRDAAQAAADDLHQAPASNGGAE